MKRVAAAPRSGWEARVTDVGLIYHSPDNKRYWDESVHYRLTAVDVEKLESATDILHQMCLEAVQHVIDTDLFGVFGITEPWLINAIKLSWEKEPPSIYGRFDLVYTGKDEPKLLEYNADTPTALLEAAVVQWHWLKDIAPQGDQFNSIHDKLVAKWRELRDYLPPTPLYFGFVSDEICEDLMTITYLADTAREGGLTPIPIKMVDIGLAGNGEEFFGADGTLIQTLFKLYPWEWLVNEEFGDPIIRAIDDGMVVIEPVWKMLLSNKAILAVLWDLFPNHPNLLPAMFSSSPMPAPHNRSYVVKPLLSREGANVTIVKNCRIDAKTDGEYGEEGYVYQAIADIEVDGKFPVFGSWVIDGEAAGVGILESDTPITGNLSRFVPHLME